MNSFEELEVWKVARLFRNNVYLTASKFYHRRKVPIDRSVNPFFQKHYS
ncbi:hypothetical protein MUY27_10860 [Mucilaginibacter sp. RS28]|uniref:Uncharacterized protein n=1 Tax=Mucilaginibacter straminoryzae TaxID=2932774 RepID=A0A9X2BBU4_9SPHI|nr:hypothetical protein [Mucilaginibacter straminoryzae]MCJ8210212.1 hypothetical protein [Mucilaginibacter straminoryzae]